MIPIGTTKDKKYNMSSNYGQLLKDLQVGFEEGEEPVKAFLKQHFGITTRNVGKQHIGWDLEVVGVDKKFLKGTKRNPATIKKKFINKFGRTFEVKRDKASDRTNNFFYEVWSNLRVHNPGCLQASKADVIVIVRKKEFIFIDRGYLLSWIMYQLYHDSPMSKRWKRKTCRRVKEVEMKNSPISPYVRGILIPIEDIKNEASIAIFKR